MAVSYTPDAADEGLGVDLGGRRIIKKKTQDTLLLLLFSYSPFLFSPPYAPAAVLLFYLSLLRPPPYQRTDRKTHA